MPSLAVYTRPFCISLIEQVVHWAFFAVHPSNRSFAPENIFTPESIKATSHDVAPINTYNYLPAVSRKSAVLEGLSNSQREATVHPGAKISL